MSDKGKVLSNVIFGFFGEMYRGTMKSLAEQAPAEIRHAFVTLINEARKRSGLPPQKTLLMLKIMRDALNHIIARESNAEPSI